VTLSGFSHPAAIASSGFRSITQKTNREPRRRDTTAPRTEISGGDVPTEPSHPHRPPPLIGLILRCGLLNQPVVNHARERAIQRSRMEPQTAVSPTLDVFEDVVAMPLAVGKREEYFERHFSQR
jgi:hypothetical protein